ncbi:unnamed protein product [Amoebophrya sp. A25]|nr:unnamed protein product [Amoebophrya sp. A25]|eukprot:GSA25T00024415001.1
MNVVRALPQHVTSRKKAVHEIVRGSLTVGTSKK